MDTSVSRTARLHAFPEAYPARGPECDVSVLVTGAAGPHLVARLLDEGAEVVGLDNFDPFYGATVKERNLDRARGFARVTEVRGDVRDPGIVPGRARVRGCLRVMIATAHEGADQAWRAGNTESELSDSTHIRSGSAAHGREFARCRHASEQSRPVSITENFMIDSSGRATCSWRSRPARSCADGFAKRTMSVPSVSVIVAAFDEADG